MSEYHKILGVPAPPSFKEIVLTQKQQDELLKISLNSFKESGIAQAIKDEHTWWSNNILNGKKPYRVDRIEGLTYQVRI